MIGIELIHLLGLNEQNVFNVLDHYITNNFGQGSIILSETQCAHELEKSRLLLLERDKEVDYLKNENQHLQKMIELLKTQSIG
ncbi:hypothetical protein [Candidatus Venteria ishoeyi]|uniref:Uncharacterized protein n=1 Tax=Candidatus Venteria ishoeyi TaxID=1899563 RepID=A0A1H6F619_9GAMM|nr:hypothetical protein [Candidatus Venteria ishoeyi]SEH04516.1 Uncharacterised protein [Candidatus Venteria ishoeyi]SEH05790.1 Uncharacterised protein [Candidatus Venteria ishoeyi]